MRVLIVYATETGCAEALAYSTYIQLKLRRVDVSVKSAAVATRRLFMAFDRLVFMVSTAAYGEFPHSMRFMVDELQGGRRKLPVEYTIFGLGDSRYPLFNYAARKLVTLLEMAGANCFYGVGYGDDQHPLGHTGEFIPWIAGLTALWGPLEAYEEMPTTFRLKVEQLEAGTVEAEIRLNTAVGTVISNDVITANDHFRTVRNIVIQCYGQKYGPGDVCCVYPTGNPDEVVEMLQKLGQDPEQVVSIRSANDDGLEFNRDLEVLHVSDEGGGSHEGSRLPFEGKAISLRTLFVEYLSLKNVCTQWQMYFMAKHATLDIYRNKLSEMASFSIEACAEYNRYCKDERRSLFEVLCDFHLTNLPVEVLVNIATPYYPRMYSISSTPTTVGIARLWPSPCDGTLIGPHYSTLKSFLAQKSRETGLIELCVADVTHHTPYNRKVKGQASDFLANALPSRLLRLTITKSRIAEAVLDVTKPVLFICTGTGLAAVKPLMEARVERLANIWNEAFTLPHVRDMAFIGFRRRRQDHLYLANAQLLNPWCEVHVVYSREAGRKIYVQDEIVKFPKRVIEIVMNGLVIISGRSHPMPKQVMQRLRDMLVEHAGFGVRAAEKFMEGALMGGKIIMETWG
ncbi:flavodoxin domain containing protein, putative [Babesia bigemina]|uniref:Flavodoxin domain containing protein, putative n=1 Tax=Babesia bigemina TaxID=5866 RepID=A0A061D633_BABBI|nr:flavodoxin domain containing protein, putative [Babesia bigemina]CDR94379.1 flavodoxin domain containing protein, putative [Babesia bigemina]|eukprot:XP_012766565.1 flavodoxin domain containing protein, putative [Babesia bigemina]